MALDAARLGARAPLSTDFLRAAAPGYCTSQQQADAPETWFEQALAYATRRLHGAAAALSPVGVGMGRVVGYMVADYLIEHSSRDRRSARVPASTWDAALSHISDPADAARLADSARNRLLYRYALSLYRHATGPGDRVGALRLAMLLERRGDLDGAAQILRVQANADDGDAALSHISDPADTSRLADSARNRLLYRHAIPLYRPADDGAAALQLADLLVDRGDLEEATQILRAQTDAGDAAAASRLAKLLVDLLTKQGRSEEAERLRRFGLNPDGSIAYA